MMENAGLVTTEVGLLRFGVVVDRWSVKFFWLLVAVSSRVMR